MELETMKEDNKVLLPHTVNFNQRRTKVVCTLGPNSETKEAMEKLLKNGMNMARFNFSHGTQENHLKKMKLLREAMEDTKITCAIAQDLQGPKIRVGKLEKESIFLENGTIAIVTTDTTFIGNKEKFSCDYKDLPLDIDVGKYIYINDGKVLLQVIKKRIKEKEIDCKVLVGGEIKYKKGFNLPNTKISQKCLTEKDLNDFKFGLEHCKMDYVCLSFVREAQDILDCYNLMKDKKFNPTGHFCPIIAKIETQEAIDNLPEICKVIAKLKSGVMIARGDLAVETGFVGLSILQKKIMKECNKFGVFSICATEMLGSMVKNYLPSRSEICDISNAVFDQCCAVLLSNETAVGAYPIRSLQMMSKIAKESDKYLHIYSRNIDPIGKLKSSTSLEAMILGSVHIALTHSKVKAIVVYTKDGVSALRISSYFHRFNKPDLKIVCVTWKKETFQRMQIYWGIIPVLVEKEFKHKSDLTLFLKDMLQKQNICQIGEQKICKLGDSFVLVTGKNTIESNTVKLIHFLKDEGEEEF